MFLIYNDLLRTVAKASGLNEYKYTVYWHSRLWQFITHASGSRGVSSVISCICVCVHTLKYPVSRDILHGRPSASIDPEVKRSEDKVTGCKLGRPGVGLHVETRAYFSSHWINSCTGSICYLNSRCNNFIFGRRTKHISQAYVQLIFPLLWSLFCQWLMLKSADCSVIISFMVHQYVMHNDLVITHVVVADVLMYSVVCKFVWLSIYLSVLSGKQLELSAPKSMSCSAFVNREVKRSRLQSYQVCCWLGLQIDMTT